MTTEINNKIKSHVCEILESVQNSINASNSKKEMKEASFNHHFLRNVKFNFNLLLDNSTQDEVKVEFEVPFILKKKFMNE